MITTVRYDEDKNLAYVKISGEDTYVCVDKIRYIDTYKNYIIYHLSEGTQIKERKPLYKFAEENSCGLLLQVNKGCIVNLKFVETVRNRRVWLSSGENFGIRRGWEKEIKQRFFAYKIEAGRNGL